MIDVMAESDLSGVARLAVQLGYPNSPNELKDRFSELNKLPNCGLFVARTEKGEITGWVQISAEPTSLLTDSRAIITAMVVDENYRGKGIGKALLEHAEAWTRAKGFPAIRVRSKSTRSDAHRFYLREGYAASKISHVFEKKI